MRGQETEPVPDVVVSRLPLYLRTLTFLAEEGAEIVSSAKLAGRLGLSPAQIRKDLSHFGEFGKQGSGYQVAYLRQKLQEILHLTRTWDVALVGAGDLGHALAHYGGFIDRGFRISLVFDNNPQKIGREVGGLTVLSTELMKAELRRRQIRVAIIAVPAAAAQKVADELVDAGVSAILNYAPITLNVPAGVNVQYMDPVVHLQHMTYYLEPPAQ
jgi:redox-sensing transcriptional repressor